MEKHEFEYKGSPVRVYVSEENKLYLNAGDVAHALGVSLKVLSVDFPEWEKINAAEGGSVKVYSEAAFIRGVRAMEEAGGVDEFFTWYAAELMPKMRFLLVQKAEARWSRDDKVRQLEQDLQMKLGTGVPMETAGKNSGLKKGTFYLYSNDFVFYLDEKLKFWFDARSLADFCKVKPEVFGEGLRTVEGVKVIDEAGAIYQTAHYAEWKKNGGNKESFDWFNRVVYNFYGSPAAKIRRNLAANSDREPGRNETPQNESSGNQESIQALMNEFVQTAAHMGRLHRLATEYRGILAELDHEFKGKRVIFGKLVETIDRELAYGARWFSGTVGKTAKIGNEKAS